MKRTFSTAQEQISRGQHAYGSSQYPRRYRLDADVIPDRDFVFRSCPTWPAPTYRHPSSVERRTRNHPTPPSRFSSAFRPPFATPTLQSSVRPYAPQAPCFQLEPSLGAANGYHTSSSSRRCIPVRQTELVNSPLGGSSPCFSVVTYNVLAQDLIHKNRSLYTHCPERLLDWEYRKHNLLRELVESDAEVICLQEVQEDHYSSWYKPQLAERGYEGVYQKRTGSHMDGCAMFYKSGVLEAVGVRAVTYQRRCTPLDKDNVAIILRFRWKRPSPKSQQEAPPSTDGHTFCVATTHLLFNPKAGEIKLAQVACLLAELHSVAAEGSGDQTCPIVICGDMNSVPGSPLITFLKDGHLDYQNLSAWDIAGYYRNIGRRRRSIPVPLMPSHLGIGLDCKYCLVSRNTNEDSLAGPAGSASTLSLGSLHLSHHTSAPPLPPSRPSGTPPQSRVPSSSENGTLSHPPWGGSRGSNDPGGSSDDTCTPMGILTHPFKLCSAYDHTPHYHGMATTYHQAALETVDYILFAAVGGDRQKKGLHLLSRKALLRHDTLKCMGPQPHEYLSSDHLLLQATFQLVC